MNFFSKQWKIVLAAVAIIAVSAFVLDHFIGFNPISTAVNTVTAPVKTGFSYIADSLADAKDFVLDMRAYREDNARLAAENIKLKQQSRDAVSYREENERLNMLLNLRNSMPGRATIAARIISYSGSSWHEKIEINRGSVHGIKKGDAVIAPEGLVGRVTEIGPDYAVVTTVLDPSSRIGVLVSRSGGSGLIEGDAELAKSSQCKLSYLEQNTPLIAGDVLETSGSGGRYPAGFAVGSVMSISADSSGTLNSAVIVPAVDFDRLGEVLVICGIN